MRHHVSQVDIGEAVGVAGPEIGGAGLERHVPPVRGDDGVGARRVPLRAARRDAGPVGAMRDAVADEDVPRPVGIAGDEVRGEGLERHVAPVR